MKVKGMVCRRSNKEECSVVFLLILYLFYYVYRYIFKVNSSLTSSTYTDTPFWLQSLKYLIVSVLIIYIFFFSKIKISCIGKLNLNRFLFLLLIIQFSLFGIYTYSFTPLAFSLILFPCYLLWSCRINYLSVERVLSFFWYFSVLYEVIQIALYLVYGRLPALAHPYNGWLNVRFGGPLDDPNSFSIILSFYFFYHLLKYKGVTRFIFISFSSLMLVLTLSLTGIISIIGTTVIVCFFRYHDRALVNSCIMYFIVFLIFLGIILIPNFEFFEKLIRDFLSVKQESINSHFDSWNLKDVLWWSYFGVSPNDVGGEIGFLRLLSIGGIPAVIIFSFIIAKSVLNLTNKIKTNNLSQYPFFVGTIAYLVTFFIANFNLPVVFIFPTLGVFSIIVIVANSNSYV